MIVTGTLDEDTEAPVINEITPKKGTYLAGSVLIRVDAQDNLRVAEIDLFYSTDNGETWIPLTDAPTAEGQWSLDTTAVARDAAGHESDPSIQTYIIDNLGPEKVTGVTFSATATAVTLVWADVADNDIAVQGVRVQVSTNGRKWTDVYAETFTGAQSVVTLRYQLDLTSYKEGEIYVRAVVTDQAGNQSATDASAPFVQYMLDRTAPAAPQNVTAVGQNGYIKISWEQGPEDDIAYYAVYSTTAADGVYSLMTGGIEALNCL